MNNEQFRRLVLDQPGKKTTTLDKNAQTNKSPNQSSPPSSSALLGSRMRSSIPMTPRHVRGGTSNTNEFARQLAEQRREEQPPAKRFKASAAPKGTKFTSGYQDRTALRRQQKDDEDEQGSRDESVEQRLKALEDMVKLGQIDQQTFDKLRKEIGVGGDLKSTHLVKGLDWDLLKRAKAGEDLSQKKEEEKKDTIDAGDVDEELDRVLEEKEAGIAAVPKEKKVKKGNLAAAPPSGKLSRDEILKQLKASRAAAAAQQPKQPTPPESTLSNKFKKIDKSDKKRWIETDPSTGRRKEILVITDAEGNSKRKVRWLDKEQPDIPKIDDNGLLRPGRDSKPLGMEVPAVIAARIADEKAAAEAVEDDDIFAGVGTDYNPLGDLEEEDDDDSDAEEKEEKADDAEIKEAATAAIEPSTQPRRNYFKDSKTGKDAEDVPRMNPLTSDPTLLAAFKRAAALRQSAAQGKEDDDDHAVAMEENEFANDDDDPERLARRKKFLEEARRRDALDALDLDYGFGSSRIEDEEDEEGPTFGDGPQRGGNKRKRGPKKRKGDKDSATDVLRVMEGRKKS
ncbi:conserved hypothetical protein [Talaromyces stipitatus ATCC 10500]|uniref:RED-like N-terminal domain-containing protein n=1 Tax=Talaromyces stipitatus (strain ATCC 10500 / CBS 375.48 / QM 6759 / NRRL 1006) TaxID=441959 RepID=B8M1K8_TALSN|nr:uncharacterized protein TSTA_093410 [Talaromyces stipitatus ATCC 10500]EED22095.1 conserved hypothetical protein [Talaromyces stipitatus ATCC 10500]